MFFTRTPHQQQISYPDLKNSSSLLIHRCVAPLSKIPVKALLCLGGDRKYIGYM